MKFEYWQALVRRFPAAYEAVLKWEKRLGLSILPVPVKVKTR